MPLQYPKRTKDLPKLDIDSEDEINTPCKAVPNSRSSQKYTCYEICSSI